jgi:hypothetical protein
MPCCGQNREKARMAVTTAVVDTKVPAPKAVQQSAAVPLGRIQKLHYNGMSTVQVRGPQTGRTYVFTRTAPDVPVDRRDAESLMRIGLFRLAAL